MRIWSVVLLSMMVAGNATAQLSGLPDLFIERIVVGPTQIIARVGNRGAVSSPPTTVTLMRGKAGLQVPALARGAHADLSFPPPAPGSYFHIAVDPDDLVAETNETNNSPLLLSMPANGRTLIWKPGQPPTEP